MPPPKLSVDPFDHIPERKSSLFLTDFRLKEDLEEEISELLSVGLRVSVIEGFKELSALFDQIALKAL